MRCAALQMSQRSGRYNWCNCFFILSLSLPYARILHLCTGQCIPQKRQKYCRVFWQYLMRGHPFLSILKNFRKKEKRKVNMPLETSCSNFSQIATFVLLSRNHIYHGRHISKWSYGHMAIRILCCAILISLER